MKVKQDGLRKFQKQLKELGKMRVRIGCVGDHGDGISNNDLMLIHEFGTSDKRIPPRMPIRTTFRHEGSLNILKKTLEHAQKTHFKPQTGFDIQAIGETVGNAMAELVKGTIRRRLSPPLAESTLKAKSRKGQSSVPLYATGRLLNSIQFEVRK